MTQAGAATAFVRIPIDSVRPGRPGFFTFERDQESLTGFVVLHEGVYNAYVNRCPHVPYSLDFGDEEVMDKDGQFILCQTHGARFLPESGACFWGPPMGFSLERFPCREDGGVLEITILPEPPGWPSPEPCQ